MGAWIATAGSSVMELRKESPTRMPKYRVIVNRSPARTFQERKYTILFLVMRADSADWCTASAMWRG
jgi:hypothetical protein